MHVASGPHIVRTFEEEGMDHEDVGSYWDENAQAWTELVRAGYDHYRDGLNSPAFLAMLPEVHPSLPRPPLHANPERVAEPTHRHGVRTRTPGGTAPER